MLTEIIVIFLVSSAGLFLYELNRMNSESARFKAEHSRSTFEMAILLESILKSMPQEQLNSANNIYNSLKAQIGQNNESQTQQP